MSSPRCSPSILIARIRRSSQAFGESLVQLKRWKEAKPVFEKIAALDPGNFDKQMDLMKCYLALKDYASYRRVCEAGIARHGKTQDPNPGQQRDLACRAHSERRPQLRRGHRNRQEDRRLTNADGNECNTFGAVLYRAGQYSELADIPQKIDRRPEREGKRLGLGLHGDGPPPVEAARRPGSTRRRPEQLADDPALRGKIGSS